jgi:hypothetical protein
MLNMLNSCNSDSIQGHGYWYQGPAFSFMVNPQFQLFFDLEIVQCHM